MRLQDLGDYIPNAVEDTARERLRAAGRPVGARSLILPVVPEPEPGMSLRAVLDAELQRETMLYDWHTYGNDSIAIAGNASVDTPLPLDPSCYFLGLELQFRVPPAQNLNNVTVQLILDGDKQMFREAMPLNALVNNATGVAGVWPFPREWLCKPGGSAVIRTATRSAVAATLDIFVGGYKLRVS